MKLTSINFAPSVTLNSLIHVVNTGDTSQSPDGSSYNAPLSEVIALAGIANNEIWSASTGTNSVVKGNSLLLASGQYSLAEGLENTASGFASHAGGYKSVAFGTNSFAHSTNSLVYGARSAVLGGQGITGITNDTVYVPYLNLSYTPSADNSATNILVRASDGTIKSRSYNSFTPLTWVTRTNLNSQVYNIPGVNYGIVNRYSSNIYSEYVLPANCSVGDVIEIIEDKPSSSKTRVRANTGQTIRVSGYGTTTSGGYFETENSNNVALRLVCIIPNQKWVVTNYFSDYNNGIGSTPTIN